jgi:hypothetical protein
MKESRSETLWNKEIRRCCVVDIGDKARKAREGWYEQITKRKAAGQRPLSSAEAYMKFLVREK